MPPKPGPSNEGPRKLKFGLFGDRRSKNTIPDPTTSRAPPSAGGESNSQRAIRNARLALDALRTASDISEVLGPLKLLCFALKVVVDTAEGVVQNNEDLTKLREKLKRQLSFVEDKTKSLADPRFRPSRAAVQGLVKSLQEYTSELSTLQEKLEGLKHQDKSRTKQVFKKIMSVHSDREDIHTCATQLDEAFQLLMHSVTFFIADQTGELLARQALDRLLYVEGAQGNQHSACLEGTRKNILEEITQWANDGNAEPIFCLIDQAGTGKSTIVSHMARQWQTRQLLLSQFFFSKPKAITSGENVAATLATDMAIHSSSIRPYVIKVIEDYPTISGFSIEKKLELLVVSPLKKLREERAKALELIQEEKQRKLYMDGPNWDGIPEEIRSQDGIADIRDTYLEALKTAEKEGRSVTSLRTLEGEYMTYMDALRQALEQLLAFPPIIVIDALDECSHGDRDKVLRPLLDACLGGPAPFKLLFTCRPEADIIRLINNEKYARILCRFKSSLKEAASNQEDISLYAHSRLAGMLDPIQIAQFIKQAQGLFIWASTAADFILRPGDPIMRLENLLAAALPNHPLDSLYSSILAAAFATAGNDQRHLLDNLLKTICVAREPLTVDAMDELLEMRRIPGYSVSGSLIASLRSVLSDGSDGKAVQILHPTFLEYLLRDRPKEGAFVLKSDAEVLVARGCLTTLLSGQLKYDICEVTRPSEFAPLNSEIKNLQQLVQTKTSAGLRYAAVHGLSHVSSSLQDTGIVERLRQFYETKLPYWVELISFLGKIYPLIISLHALKRGILDATKEMNISLMVEAKEWCEEIIKLMQSFQGVIEESALQVYSSAVAFAPQTGRIFRNYHEIIPIPNVLLGSWSLKSQPLVLGGHKNSVTCLSFSPDGRWIASGSNDRTVRLWDVQTGAAVGTPLVGHTSEVEHLSFSPDGQRLASGTSYKIFIWDTETGEALTHLNHEVQCLQYLPDGLRMASGSAGHIQVWEAATGALVCEHILGTYPGIKCISFSPDGRRVATTYDDTIQLWDTETGEAVGKPFVGNLIKFTCLAHSSNGGRIAWVLDDRTIRIGDTETGAISKTITAHKAIITCLSFSPNSQIVASGSEDRTIQLWNAETGLAVGKPLNRKSWIKCMSFSVDGQMIASGGLDDTVQVLEADTGETLRSQVAEHTAVISCLCFSPDGKVTASGSIDNTVRLWDANTGSAIGTPIQLDSFPSSLQLHLLNSILYLLIDNSDIYDLSTDPPALCRSFELPAPLPVTRSIRYEAPWTYVETTNTVTRFRLPSTFNPYLSCIHEGKIAYGGWEGTVIIVDCTHLL